jgi:hypothetical protein
MRASVAILGLSSPSIAKLMPCGWFCKPSFRGIITDKFNRESMIDNQALMKFRQATLPNAQTFQVPQGIQRIDSTSTHGWQVRYQGSKFFSDGPNGLPQESLANAIHELMARITSMPAPSALNRGPNANKSTDLPSGISGPIVRERPGRPMIAELSVLLPRFGRSALHKKVYIGSQNTYTPDKYREALAKSIELRTQAIEQYELDAAKARKGAVTALRAQIKALRDNAS